MPSGVQGDPDNYLSLLSAAQIETLRHVFEHKNSKEIARIMDVSPHTVDERVRRALKKLNVSNRVDAAKILASNGVFENVTPYQSLTYQLAELGDDAPPGDAETGRSSLRQVFDIGLPFPTASQPTNRHVRVAARGGQRRCELGNPDHRLVDGIFGLVQFGGDLLRSGNAFVQHIIWSLA